MAKKVIKNEETTALDLPVVNEVVEVAPEIRAEVLRMIDSGSKLSAIRGFLAYKELGQKDITKLILNLFPAKALIRDKTIRSEMWKVCEERVMDDEEFENLFKNDWVTENMRKSKNVFNSERKMFNKIHEKYSS
jgi:hypothetical protein